MKGTLLSVLLLFACAYQASANEPATYEPATPWVFDYADDHCSFSREFGDVHDRVRLEFRQYAPGTSATLLISTKQRPTADKPLSVRFLPYEEVRQDPGAFTMQAEGWEYGWMGWINFGPLGERQTTGARQSSGTSNDTELIEWAADIESLAIVDGFDSSLVLKTGSMSDIRQVMNHCLLTLVEAWGIDTEMYASQTRSPIERSSARTLEKALRYLSQDLKFVEGAGAMHLLMLINEKGKVTSCTSLAPIASEAHIAAICKGLSRYARFKPALDRDGDPFASFYIYSLRYFGDDSP